MYGQTINISLGKRSRPPFECIALVLQGGGALGAYQAGVYEALAEAGLHPDLCAAIGAYAQGYTVETSAVKVLRKNGLSEPGWKRRPRLAAFNYLPT